MEEQVQGVASVATAMGQLSARAAQAANAQRLRIAQGNVNAGMAQLDQQATVQQRTIARSLSRHLGQSVASSAFRGVAGRSVEQGEFAAAVDASEQVAIVQGNRAAQEAALIASNQVTLEDPLLAGVQGAVQGLDIGTQIARALQGLGDEETDQSSEQVGSGPGGGGPTFPTFSNTITTSFETPGLDLSNIFNMNNGQITFGAFGIQ